MKLIKDPIKKNYGICYIPHLTDEFDKLIESAKKLIEPHFKKETSDYTVYFKVKDEEVDGEHDCCDNEKCIEQAKKDIRKVYGKGTHVEEIIWNNDGDHENIEICSVCSKPLNEFLTWANYELEYLEENKPWTIEFIKEQGFLIYSILQSMPTMDNDISEYAKHQNKIGNSEPLEKALKRREQFFQRVKDLVDFIVKNLYNE